MMNVNKKELKEQEIRTMFITPALKEKGWEVLKNMREEYYFTDGRVLVAGSQHSVAEGKKADYLLYHKQEFIDTIALCPNWTLVDFYVDEGQTAPYMENAKAWSRLLQDCLDGKIDLIITQKVSNVTRNPAEITLVARLLATQKKPIGMYFVNEDIFTLASYYQEDMREKKFFPSPDWQMLPDDPAEERRELLE